MGAITKQRVDDRAGRWGWVGVGGDDKAEGRRQSGGLAQGAMLEQKGNTAGFGGWGRAEGRQDSSEKSS